MIKILKLEDWMSSPVKTIGNDNSVLEAAEKMAENDMGCLGVMENEEIKGIITERDIIKKVVAHHKDPEEVKVEEIMSKNPETIDINTTFLELSNIMSERNFRRMLITKENKLVGVITSKDIVRMLSTEED